MLSLARITLTADAMQIPGKQTLTSPLQLMVGTVVIDELFFTTVTDPSMMHDIMVNGLGGADVVKDQPVETVVGCVRGGTQPSNRSSDRKLMRVLHCDRGEYAAKGRGCNQ